MFFVVPVTFSDMFILNINVSFLAFIGLNIFISNQFIQYNTIVNHTNIRIRTEAKAYQVLLLYNILTKCIRQ